MQRSNLYNYTSYSHPLWPLHVIIKRFHIPIYYFSQVNSFSFLNKYIKCHNFILKLLMCITSIVISNNNYKCNIPNAIIRILSSLDTI